MGGRRKVRPSARKSLVSLETHIPIGVDPLVMNIIDRIGRVVLSKPLVPDRDKLAVERRIFPSEVSYVCQDNHETASTGISSESLTDISRPGSDLLRIDPG